MHPPLPITDELVLIGGGHSHTLVLKAWAMAPVPGVRLTVINPDATAPYTGMLPGHVAGHYPRGALDIDLVRLARHAGARLILGRASAIDRAARRITVPGRADVFYDLASVDIGITSDLPQIRGFAEFGRAAKPLGAFAAAWQRFVADSGAGARDIVVIGGGVGGVELALAMAQRLKGRGIVAQVTVVEQAGHVLEGLGRAARKALLDHLQRLDIAVETSAMVNEIACDQVWLSDGRSLPSDFVVGAGGARPQAWIKGTGLALNKGFISVNPFMQSLTDPRIFAVGDCADLSFAPRPKAGVFAVRQAPVLLNNLRAELTGRRMRPFKPQKDYLKLVSTGGKGAVADKWGLRLDGAWLWRLKDRIDRKFMDQFVDLKAMPAPGVPVGASRNLRVEMAATEPLCGGCGAKMGGAGLADILSVMPAPARSDVVSGPGDDAAVLRYGTGFQVITTDHLRAFCLDPWLMTQIAAQHALGDIWAMGAQPQTALVQLTLPRMAPHLHSEMLREIMASAGDVFAEAGADIVGGHTSVGAELTVGFTVTGLSATRPVGLNLAQAGDRLILTKPIGSGTVMAGEMRLKAEGDWVAAAYRSMGRGQGVAAGILAPVARAMTDVTGFGLAGHLAAILAASKVSARLDQDLIPLMAGALELAKAGIRSSLWAQNRAAVTGFIGDDSARSALLFDPQTAGGLLAAVPADRADAVLANLRAAGEPAALIGTLEAGDGMIRL